MAKFLGSRSTIQCRTHHQKFEAKLGSTQSIIEVYINQVGIVKFKKIVKEVYKDKQNDRDKFIAT